MTFKGQGACGTVSRGAVFLNQHRYILCILALVFGLVLTFLGGVYFDVIIPVTGFVLASTITGAIIFAVGKYEQTSANNWKILGAAILVGVIAAFIISMFIKVSYLVFGFFFGYVIATQSLVLIQSQWLNVILLGQHIGLPNRYGYNLLVDILLDW